jgi:hypothetical protein
MVLTDFLLRGGFMTKEEILRRVMAIFEDATDLPKKIDLTPEEIKVRFLYKHGLLFDLTIKQVAMISPLSESYIRSNLTKWGFRKIGRVYITNIQNHRAVMSGKSLEDRMTWH